MEIYKIVGFRKCDFETKDGKHIDGYSLYVLRNDENVTGYVAERVFCSHSALGSYTPRLNDEIKVMYNRFGKPASVEVNK